MPDIVISVTNFLAIQGVVLSAIFILKSSIRKSNSLYLVLFLLSFSLFLLGKNLYWGSFYLENPHFIMSVISLPLLFGPFLFLYMVPRKPKWVRLLHFIPFLLVLTDHIPFYILDKQSKVHFLEEMVYTGDTNARFFIYRIIILSQTIYYLIQMKNFVGQYHFSSRIKWLRTVSFLFGGFGIIYLFQMVVYGFFNSVSNIALYFAILMLAMACIILFLFTKIIVVPELLKWKDQHGQNGSGLKDLEDFQIVITKLMMDEKLYTNPRLRVVDLAHRLDLTEQQLSRSISMAYHMNFHEFVNSYRIADAKTFLRQPEYENYTIDAIASEVGFKSKSSFYEAFRKLVGTTPSVYKKARI